VVVLALLVSNWADGTCVAATTGLEPNSVSYKYENGMSSFLHTLAYSLFSVFQNLFFFLSHSFDHTKKGEQQVKSIYFSLLLLLLHLKPIENRPYASIHTEYITTSGSTQAFVLKRSRPTVANVNDTR
jgi:hypothetical protein